MESVQKLKKINRINIYSSGLNFFIGLSRLPMKAWKHPLFGRNCPENAYTPALVGIQTKPQNSNRIDIKRLFISMLLLSNPEIYGEDLPCHQSWQETLKATSSYGNKSSEQTRGSNYLVDYLRNKYPIRLSAEKEKELITRYQTTNDPKISDQISEQILGSIILFVWKTVRKVLFRFLHHYDPMLADDLLQGAVKNIRQSLKSYDTSRPERFLTYFGKNLESSIAEQLYEQRSVVRIPKGSNGKLPVSIHAKSEDEASLEDSLSDPNIITAEQQINQEEITARFHEDVKIVFPLLKNEMEHQILQGLLDDFNEDDWRQLQEKHSITKNQLRTKQNKILRILRSKLDPSAF